MRRAFVGALLVGVGMAGLTSLVNADDKPAPSPETLLYDARGRRDPFMPLVRDGRPVAVIPESSSTTASGDFVLIGILWDPHGQSLALINDTEVREGDMIGDYQVADIEQNAVVLVDGDGQRLVLEISFDTDGDATGGES